MIVWGGSSLNSGGIYRILPLALDCTATACPTWGVAPLAVSFGAIATPTGCDGIATFLWDFGDGGTSIEPNASHTYATPGRFTWTVTSTLGSRTCSQSGGVAVAEGLPGDCDGNGRVSIGEIQKAVNMFLVIVPASCDADTNGDGTISIGEVQKVINAFLGLASSC
jgi:hypothetical protein